MKNIYIIKLIINDKFGFIISVNYKLILMNNLFKYYLVKFLYYYKFVKFKFFIIIKIIGC